MGRLNKKLSENTEKKIEQLDSASLKYLVSLCFLLTSVKTITGLGPYLTTLASITIFWAALSIDTSKRIYLYLSSILLSAYFLNHQAFLLGGIFAVLLIGSGRALKHYTNKETVHLLLTGILSHLGDLYTTSLGLQMGLSEQNPFIQYLEGFTDIPSGLFLSKMILFLLAVYLYNKRFENVNSLLKIFLISGFFLTLANLNAIMIGI